LHHHNTFEKLDHSKVGSKSPSIGWLEPTRTIDRSGQLVAIGLRLVAELVVVEHTVAVGHTAVTGHTVVVEQLVVVDLVVEGPLC